MVLLQCHGGGTSRAVGIYKTYGANAIPLVSENPYRRARDIKGIGFKTADKIAQELGVDPLSPFRAEAALEHTLSELADEGHVFAPAPGLVAACVNAICLPEGWVGEAMGALPALGRETGFGQARLCPR